MPLYLAHNAPDFEERFRDFLAAERGMGEDVSAAVADIIGQVRSGGIGAVIDLTRKFDRWEMTEETATFSEAEIEAACASVSSEDHAALDLAAERIRAYHIRQLPQDEMWTDDAGARLGWRWGAVDSAGLYVPGGLASYPSSVLMNAIPAAVAGVRDLTITMPTPDGAFNPATLAAARLAGIRTIYRAGGAQAVAALAYGAGPIRQVDKIAGPGNAWVAEAKRQVFGRTGIDAIAGPSEVLVIADRTQNPDWIAADLMSQAEHDESAQAILITDDDAFGKETGQAVDRLLQRLQRSDIAGASWRNHGAIIIAGDMAHAAELANRIAPEHLQLCVEDPLALSEKIRHAGAIFLGAHTPEVIGDYVAGPNHVLPTARTARFSSGLSVLDFMKRTTLTQATPSALATIGPTAEQLAQSEGLEAHALSVRARLDNS